MAAFKRFAFFESADQELNQDCWIVTFECFAIAMLYPEPLSQLYYDKKFEYSHPCKLMMNHIII